MSVNSNNPGILFNFGKWEQLEGRFLFGSSSEYNVGSTGGEKKSYIDYR